MIRIETPTRDQLLIETLADKIVEVIKEVSPHSAPCRAYDRGCNVFGHPVMAVLVGGHRIPKFTSCPEDRPTPELLALPRKENAR
jgi:hypothetical protein